MYNDKGNTKYLKLLKQNYSSSQDVIREIVNLSAIINLPKGTEFFLSDIHGEYEAFLHIMNNCSGVIKEKVDLIFKDTISDYDRQELCTLIYYPREKMALLDEQGKIDSDWYAMTLNQLILVAKLLSSKYTRSKVRKALPEEYAYISGALSAIYSSNLFLNPALADVNEQKFTAAVIRAQNTRDNLYSGPAKVVGYGGL
jgi:fructose-1,6-bisphosphatase-3